MAMRRNPREAHRLDHGPGQSVATPAHAEVHSGNDLIAQSCALARRCAAASQVRMPDMRWTDGLRSGPLSPFPPKGSGPDRHPIPPTPPGSGPHYPHPSRRGVNPPKISGFLELKFRQVRIFVKSMVHDIQARHKNVDDLCISPSWYRQSMGANSSVTAPVLSCRGAGQSRTMGASRLESHQRDPGAVRATWRPSDYWRRSAVSAIEAVHRWNDRLYLRSSGRQSPAVIWWVLIFIADSTASPQEATDMAKHHA
jgi:hypothetical protein